MRGSGIACDPPPGRVMMIGPSHLFAQLADAIDARLRGDLSHLHEFELPVAAAVCSGPTADA